MVRWFLAKELERIFVFIFSTSMVLATSAQAQTVTLNVQGTLEASCSLSGLPAANVSIGDVSVAGVLPLNFSVDCNAPFAYALVSGNGGLMRLGGAGPMAPGSATFASVVSYNVTTNFNTDAGNFGDTALAASSLTMANAAPCIAPTYSSACPFNHSGSGAAATGLGASLSIAWTPPSIPLQAGTYQDTLTLTVRART